MSGISTGSFYSFYPSKEALFADTANACSKKLYDIMDANKSELPTKSDFARGMKQCADELFANRWFFSLREDAERILRKLPDGYLEQDFSQDLLDITAVIKAYHLVPKASMETITAAFHTLLMSVYLTEIIGEAHKQALYLLIDSAIESLFE